MRATRFDTGDRGTLHGYQMRQFVVRLFPETGVLDDFAWQGAIDENGLAFLAGNTPRLMIQRLDDPDRHDSPRKKREFYQSAKLNTMARELITSWNDYHAAVDRLLALADGKIAVYDEDLANLHLGSPSSLDHLQRLLTTGHGLALRIVVRNAAPLQRQQEPGLLKLLSIYGHRATVLQAPEHLARLRDNMLIVDDRHALIRFDREQARSKLLLDEADEVRAYINRFEDIWTEGGETVSTTTLGL